MGAIIWRELSDGGAGGAGEEWYYLVIANEAAGVRLTRWLGGAQDAAWQACRNTVIFEGTEGMGPAGMGAAADLAKSVAQQFEDGGSVQEYPAWRNPQRLGPAMHAYADRVRQRRGAGSFTRGPGAYVAPVETGQPWRSGAEQEWDETRGGD